jgi:hypothetical protein
MFRQMRVHPSSRIHRPGSSYGGAASSPLPWSFVGLSSLDHSLTSMVHLQQLAAQKDIVILIDEGTASSAEVFALHYVSPMLVGGSLIA